MVFIKECIGMPLFYIEGYLGFSNLMQRRICFANERNKQKNNNIDCEESKKSIYASDWVQQKEDTDFLVNYTYCYRYDIKKLPQLIFDYMLNKEIKRLETMLTAKNNIVANPDESVTEALNEGDIIEQKNKSTKTKKFFSCFRNKKTANTEDRKYETEVIPKNNTNKIDNVTNHLLYKRSYTGLMEQLIKMLKDDSSLHNILMQNNEAFIAKYTQDESFYLMLILRNCILAAKHEALQQETIMFYEQALQNYIIKCQKNNLKYANESYKTILTLQLNNKSKKLKLLYIKWSKDNRKS
ncbi:hypothetical protein BDAP_001003 [Binucleata daphniae]